jgi:hypothetical protein
MAIARHATRPLPPTRARLGAADACSVCVLCSPNLSRAETKVIRGNRVQLVYIHVDSFNGVDFFLHQKIGVPRLVMAKFKAALVINTRDYKSGSHEVRPIRSPGFSSGLFH